MKKKCENCYFSNRLYHQHWSCGRIKIPAVINEFTGHMVADDILYLDHMENATGECEYYESTFGKKVFDFILRKK